MEPYNSFSHISPISRQIFGRYFFVLLFHIILGYEHSEPRVTQLRVRFTVDF